MSPPREHLRLTREGALASLVVAGLAALAFASGNNLVYLLLSPLIALGGLALLLGAWNLGGLHVARVLPAELFAGVEGRGRYVVRNPRRYLPAIAVTVAEIGGPGASVHLAAVPAGGEGAAPAGWRFERRGPAAFGTVRLSSSFPFGWVERWRDVELPAEVLVYPRPQASVVVPEPGSEGLDDGRSRVTDLGEFAGLRPYRPGDPPRAVHWPTTARLGEPMVVQRAGIGAERVVVRVPDRRGAAWERELQRACGEVLRAFRAGCHVGLELPGVWLDARAGDPWRRALLDALARQPVRDES